MKLHVINRMLRLCSQMLILMLSMQPLVDPFAEEIQYITPLGLS